MVIFLKMEYDYNGFKGDMWVAADTTTQGETKCLKECKKMFGAEGFIKYKAKIVEMRVRSVM